MMETNSYQRLKSFPELQADVAGKWQYIFDELAPELAEALAAAPNHVPCPVHGGIDGFRLYKDFHDTGGGVCNTCGAFRSGFSLLAWVRGYSAKDATRDVGRWSRGEQENPTTPLRAPPKVFKRMDPTKAYERIRAVWLASLPLAGTSAEAYLAKRGIWKQNMPATLRFHPGLDWYDPREKRVIGTFPCLIAPIKDAQGRLISIHRIYLTPEGNKAPVPEVKKMMAAAGELRGAAIKLQQSGDVLGLAEGIETALAAHAISRMPVWSCITARLLENVIVPESVNHVVIWSDLDLSQTGLQSAKRLSERLVSEGKTVEIAMPDLPIREGEKGVDWLDVLLRVGVPGFPKHWQRWSEEQTLAA